MKKLIAYILFIAILITAIISSIPKKELPTEEEWEQFLAWEEEFLQWRDGPATELCLYQIIDEDFIGSLQECKDRLAVTEYHKILPYKK